MPTNKKGMFDITFKVLGIPVRKQRSHEEAFKKTKHKKKNTKKVELKMTMKLCKPPPPKCKRKRSKKKDRC